MLFISCTFVLFLIGCNNSQENKKIEKAATDVNFRLPTASEVFHLRSECAKLGEKILSENFIGNALVQSQTSKYDTKSNRCYVELFITSSDFSLDEDKKYRSSNLYDGQTGELLAYATENMGKTKFGSFKVPQRSYDATVYYINQIMNDDDYTPKK